MDYFDWKSFSGFVHIEALLLLMTFKTFIDILVFNRLFAMTVGA